MTPRTPDRAAPLVVRNPASGAVLAELPVAGTEDVVRAAACARTAQREWSRIGIQRRSEMLLRFRGALVANSEQLLDTLVAETGKARQEALLQELFLLLDYVTWVTSRAGQTLSPETLELHLLKHRRSVLHYEPRQLTGVISPWNYPLLIPFTGAVAALVTGSAVLVKPSEHTPLTAIAVERIWKDAGLPVELLQVLVGASPTAEALVRVVDQVLFTGGVANGRRVAEECGRRLIPCTLELGGLAPLIVLADADLERAAQAICFGAFANAGQACISVERIYVERTVYHRLLTRVAALAERLRIGDPSQGVVDVGAITVEAQLDKALAQIADAVARGARVVAGGHRLPGPGRFLQPTVIADCNHSMRIMLEESFCPIAPFMPFDRLDDAIRLANEPSVGLAAYLFTRDLGAAERLGLGIHAGSVLVNDVMSHYGCPEVPLAGMKDSGLGSVHGQDSLRQLCQVRHISLPRIATPTRDPTWFPYSAAAYGIGRRAVESWFSSDGLLRRLRDLFGST